MFRNKLKFIYLNKNVNKEPFRSELFNIDQLGEYAKILAGEEQVGEGSKNNYLRERLNENEVKLQNYNTDVLSAKKTHYISPATEWLIDNFYLVEEHIQLARHHFPKSYSKELPCFLNEPYKNLPRIYGISAEYISHVDAQIDGESLRAFFKAYQEVSVLKLGELWAAPIMLRLILIENLRRIVNHLEQDQKDRNLANEWMDKAEKMASEKTSALVGVVSDMAHSNIPLSSAFVAEFSKRLSSRNSSLGIVRNWFEQKLQDEGISSEELIHMDTQRQAADQISVSHSIKSLRFINSMDWKTFVEDSSIVERLLQDDPAGVYKTMDFTSRDHYRHVVERLAQQSLLTEEAVARQTVALAKEKFTLNPESREGHIGYFLTDDGQDELKEKVRVKNTFNSSIRKILRKYPLTFYAGNIILVSCLLTWLFCSLIQSTGLLLTPGRLWLLNSCFFIFITQFAVFLVNYVATLIVSPDFLPRLDFKEGIPNLYHSFVVIPTMISNQEGVDKLVSDLEIHYLSNHDNSLRFALLTDFTDSPHETEPEDSFLTDYIRTGIQRLNEKYGAGSQSIFYLFHRPRVWNEKEKKWMGYERKRGKLMALNNFLITGSTQPFLLTEGDLTALKGVKYVITLDTDTQLPPCSIHKLVGTMAHVLNQPVIDPARNIVVKGYGILQPRVAINLTSSLSSRFARLFTDEVGVDPYTRSVSNVYQDVFHEGSFVGKGIYDVDIFEKVLQNRFPENRILSHDLLESTYVRSGLLGDVEIYESYPSAYNVDVKRRHRWMRGDWQIIQWLFNRVPLLSGTAPNPLSGVSRWKIADNLRRALVLPSALLFLLFFFIWYPKLVWVILLVILCSALLPLIFTLPLSLLRKQKQEPWRFHLKEVGRKTFHQLNQILFSITIFPYEAYLCIDAMVRSLWRLLVSHRHLLQWQTAEDAGRTAGRTLSAFYAHMWFSPLFAIVCLLLIRNYPASYFYTIPFAITWIAAPLIAWFISRPFPQKEAELNTEQYRFLHKIARKTWFFFETFVNEKENWLPPDNFQEIPELVVAPRTSPTNIGLSLLASISAYDMGYLSAKGVMERTSKTFITLTKLKKYKGHIYNWYDTRTLEPLYPLYVSTVDSGNLAGHLITLSQGLKDLPGQPVYRPEIFEGLLDTVNVMQEISPGNTVLKELADKLSDKLIPTSLQEGYLLLKEISELIRTIDSTLSSPDELFISWTQILQANCQDHLDYFYSLCPWLEKDINFFTESLNTDEYEGSISGFFLSSPSLKELAGLENTICCRIEKIIRDQSAGDNISLDKTTAWFRQWKEDFRQTALAAKEIIHTIQVLSLQSNQLADMDFRFLYNDKKELFTIGYNVMEQRYDSSSYDMLASEARLCSYIAIAQGQVPIEHWFSLGRLVMLVKGNPVLLSWSGSMFEYLMPLLVMPDFEETLLNFTYKGVVEEQIEYGNKFNLPWGVSESGYNRPDPQYNYQYQAFGVPSLGLKRGLSKDMVIAPYATLLALQVAPVKACENMQRLSREGFEGKYGYYEAIDYTPSHLPLNDKRVVICSFMAHHQGMSLLSLTNLIKENSMQQRFMACPQMKAFELLLQERVPHSIPTNIITDTSKLEMESLHAFHSNTIQVDRIYTKPTDVPQVNLLSNGRYHLMLNTAGAGYSRWNDLLINRWRQDPTSDGYGQFIYIRDTISGHYWSTGYQPTLTPVRDYEADFSQAYVEYRQHHTGLDITTTICISPEDDVELRCVQVTNHTHKTRSLEFTTYNEVVMTPLAADEAHPVFSNLFIQTHFRPEMNTLFCTRRARSENEQPPYLFHLMLVDKADGGDVTFETDRSRFVGRGNTLINPLALQSKQPLSGTQGAVLDPVLSLRRTVSIPPGKSGRICIISGIAATEEVATSLAEKYQNIRMTERAFDLAWTHSQVVLYNLSIREAEAQLFQRIAGSLVYVNPLLRAEEAILKNNRKGQNGLWAYAISGDLPLVIVRISKQKGLDLVRQLILAHSYWLMKGLQVELLILNEDVSVYRQPLHEEIISLVNSGIGASLLDKPGGIVVRPVDQIPGEDMVLLQTAAKAIFSDKQGTLAEQLQHPKAGEKQTPFLETTSEPKGKEKTEPVSQDLLFFNSYGGFTRNGKEYVMTLNPGKNTPTPWSNVLANPTFGTVLSESGGAYTWSENAHEFRLTPWYNDPVKDSSGEAIYIRDEETGEFWSPMPLPAKGKTPYMVRHGFGYSVFEHTENDILSEAWVFVAMDAPVKCTVIKLRNLSRRQRRLSVTGYCEWVLGDTRIRNLLHITTQKDLTTGTLLVRNFYNTDFAGRVVFMDMGKYASVTGDRKEFIGNNGSLSAPLAMKKKRLSGKTGAGPDPCGAMQTIFELSAGECKEVNLLLGCVHTKEEVTGLVTRFRQPGYLNKVLAEVQDFWDKTLGTIQVETPDIATNLMANGWLLYQTLSCRIWARSGYYQSGGAYGFRDQLQDVMALVHTQPALTREQIIRAAHHQFRKGDVQHWWHPPLNRGVRTLFSDDYLWLPYVTHWYVTTTGDNTVLHEMIPFLEGRELYPGEESYYDMPLTSDELATLYEHCVRSIRYGFKFGVHGLPLMGCGDWNDGMNLVGIEGKGESVWLGFFLYDTLLKFIEIANLYGDVAFAKECREQAQKLKENINREAWDGQWYKRAWFDDGTPLGSIEDTECRIDTLPQSWSVISGGGEAERSQLAMREVDKQLVDRELKIIRLFTPSFDNFLPSPGYIKGYIPGVRENGGQYTHGVIWTVMAFALQGETEKAWELFDMLNPVHHGNTADAINVYKTEPYVIAADVYSASQHPGRGGWTWYTGSSAWLYRLVVETLLGINRRGNTLVLTPRMRKEWDKYTVQYRYQETAYQITFHRIKDGSQPRMRLDELEKGNIYIIDLENDKKKHLVEMWIG